MSQIFPSVVRRPISLDEALLAIDRADSSFERVQAAAKALQAFGFDRVVISLRDASLNPTVVAAASESDGIGSIGARCHALKALPGAVWRRTLPAIDRYRVHELHMLDGSDPWVAREFFGADVSARSDGVTWLPTDLVVSLLHGADGELLGIVKLADPHDGRRPGESKRREIATITRHLASRLAYDAINAVAKQRAARLQRLQETGAAFARSLDEDEIIRELGRQAIRATNADGVTISAPDLDQNLLVPSLCIVRGVEHPRATVPLGDGLTAEVARTGRPVRIGDREADRARTRAGLSAPSSLDDIVGTLGAATSVLAVPMMAGIQLFGVLSVHAMSSDVFGEADEEVLVTMASQAATAIANARRYGESERERRQTEALADVARAVGESLRLGEVLRLILRHSVALLGAEGACVALRNDEYLHIVAAVGAADVLAGVHLPMATSLLGQTVARNELLVSNDFASDASPSSALHRLASVQRAVIAPLMTARGTIGALSVINRDEPFTTDDSRVLQRLADHVAVAIVNARMFEEIERATREWKVAFDSIPSGMVVLEEDLSIRRCNARAAELCGVTIPALLGKRFTSALLGDDSVDENSAIEALVHRANTDGHAARDTMRHESSGRLYSMYAAPHPDGGCVLTFDDVTTAHRLAEQHRSVLETVSDGIVITGLDGRVTFANHAAHAMFKRESLAGEGMESLVAADSLEDVARHERAALDGTHQRYECGIVCADGERRLVAVSTAPHFELGEVTGTVACLRDITAQRAGSLALARSETQRALLNGVANEIRNPLNALLSVTELEASSPALEHHDRGPLVQIRDEARRAIRAVTDALDTTLERPDTARLPAVEHGGAATRPAHSHSQGRSVLIVEDEASLRTAVARFLERQGYDVSTAPGGTEALEQLQRRSFAVILLDLRMQGMSGEETYREIVRTAPQQAGQVLFMTGDLHSPTVSEFLRSTGRPVMAKPFSLTDLEERVADLLQSA